MASRTTHIVMGEPSKRNLSELAARRRVEWTINSQAQSDDRVVFYVIRPVSAFVATGIVQRKPRQCDDESSGWYGYYIAQIGQVEMLPRWIPIQEARAAFHRRWGWLRQNRRSTPVPKEVDREFLAMLGADTIEIERHAVSAIEGLKTEVTLMRPARSRELRSRAFAAACGVCDVCRRDFSQILDGRGIRVLQVHHKRQLSAMDRPRRTSLSDLVVVCANCHLLLHIDRGTPMSVRRLRRLLLDDANTRVETKRQHITSPNKSKARR